MSKNRNRNQQPQAAGPAVKGNGGQPDLSPQERHQQYVDRSVTQIQAGTHTTIQQKTRDTAETRNFINIIDSLMFKVRMNAGITGTRIKAEDLQKYINRVNEAKESLNLVAAEMCRDMGQPYRPPRGYKNPLQGKGANATEPKKAPVTEIKQATAKKQKTTPAPSDTSELAAAAEAA
jgi:hypothetical protein